MPAGFMMGCLRKAIWKMHAQSYCCTVCMRLAAIGLACAVHRFMLRHMQATLLASHHRLRLPGGTCLRLCWCLGLQHGRQFAAQLPPQQVGSYAEYQHDQHQNGKHIFHALLSPEAGFGLCEHRPLHRPLITHRKIQSGTVYPLPCWATGVARNKPRQRIAPATRLYAKALYPR